MAGIIHVPPYPWQGAIVGKCYENVQEMIKRSGGECYYGWALTDFGPHRCNGQFDPPPLYRRWLNHVVWRDPAGMLWEVSPNAIIDNHDKTQFVTTEFLPDHQATFEFVSESEWYTRPTRYVCLRPEGALVCELLNRAQHATGKERTDLLAQALGALQLAGFRPREWKVETIGERTGSIWLIAD
jgi:hypothetical protein